MIATASNRERGYAPKTQQEQLPTDSGYTFLPPANLTDREKTKIRTRWLPTKDLPQYHNWEKPKELQARSFKRNTKQKACQGCGSTLNFAVAMGNITNPWHRVLHK